MADLLSFGSGWTPRWTIGPGQEDDVTAEVLRAGRDGTGVLAVIDPTTDAEVTLAVNRSLVAVAVVLAGHPDQAGHALTGSYA